jgi:type IV secretory pathway VirB3-like protein
MFKCPHCGNPSISLIRKLCLGPARPTSCKVCKHKVGVPMKTAMLIGIPYLILFVVAFSFAIILLPLVLFIYAKWVPLIEA